MEGVCGGRTPEGAAIPAHACRGAVPRRQPGGAAGTTGDQQAEYPVRGPLLEHSGLSRRIHGEPLQRRRCATIAVDGRGFRVADSRGASLRMSRDCGRLDQYAGADVRWLEVWGRAVLYAAGIVAVHPVPCGHSAVHQRGIRGKGRQGTARDRRKGRAGL